MNLLQELRKRFEAALVPLVDDVSPYVGMVRPAQDSRFGDFQANCAMSLAKEKRANPREIATAIVNGLDVTDLCDAPEIAGPGFINLRLRNDWLAQAVTGLLGDDRLGHQQVPAARNIVIDYSAPNVAKPMHVGHLRSSVIGNSLYRLLVFQGHAVTGDNHVGDWGTQFGMLIYGYKHFVDEGAFQENPVQELARLYRLVNTLSKYHANREELPRLRTRQQELEAELREQESGTTDDPKQRQKRIRRLRETLNELTDNIAGAERGIAAVDDDKKVKALADAHPDIAVQARSETAKLHAGDEENRRLWDRFLPDCMTALQSVYDRLGVSFDLALGESFYQPMLADTVADLQAKGIASESEGAICAFVEDNEAPFIVRKRDGAFTYATTDLATIKYRHEELKGDTILYVVDARQSEHFRLLFEVARRWGYGAMEFRHISFGTVLGDNGKPLKTREGDLIGLESLLDEALTRARTIIEENDDAKPDGPELDEATRAAVTEVVGIGGIKYADLKHNRESDYLFDWDKMLAKNGDSATYIQYAYARICGIFRRGNVDRTQFSSLGAAFQITKPTERALGLQLIRFAEAVDWAAAECRPNLLAQYLFETANSFTSFYDECPVLKEPDEACRLSRLLLCDTTARVLKLGLSLLGIDVCERM